MHSCSPCRAVPDHRHGHGWAELSSRRNECHLPPPLVLRRDASGNGPSATAILFLLWSVDCCSHYRCSARRRPGVCTASVQRDGQAGRSEGSPEIVACLASCFCHATHLHRERPDLRKRFLSARLLSVLYLWTALLGLLLVRSSVRPPSFPLCLKLAPIRSTSVSMIPFAASSSPSPSFCSITLLDAAAVTDPFLDIAGIVTCLDPWLLPNSHL